MRDIISSTSKLILLSTAAGKAPAGDPAGGQTFGKV